MFVSLIIVFASCVLETEAVSGKCELYLDFGAKKLNWLRHRFLGTSGEWLRFGTRRYSSIELAVNVIVIL